MLVDSGQTLPFLEPSWYRKWRLGLHVAFKLPWIEFLYRKWYVNTSFHSTIQLKLIGSNMDYKVKLLSGYLKTWKIATYSLIYSLFIARESLPNQIFENLLIIPWYDGIWGFGHHWCRISPKFIFGCDEIQESNRY